MRLTFRPALRFALIGIATALASCASGGDRSKTALESAERSCTVAIESKSDIARCDRYVEAARAAGDQMELARAYLYRSLMRESGGDLPGALVDVDQAIAAWPDLTLAKRTRGRLLAESGDYAGGREVFAQLEGVDTDATFDEVLALIEYVDGSRTKAASLFRSASAAYREEDNPWMAAYLGFYAAIIESEMQKGDLAPIAAAGDGMKQDRLLTLLWRHRMGEIDDPDLLQAVEALPKSPFGPLTCEPYFSIGHRNVVAGRVDAALEGFRQALQTCGEDDFEYHAAKAWLKQLGG